MGSGTQGDPGTWEDPAVPGEQKIHGIWADPVVPGDPWDLGRSMRSGEILVLGSGKILIPEVPEEQKKTHGSWDLGRSCGPRRSMGSGEILALGSGKILMSQKILDSAGLGRSGRS